MADKPITHYLPGITAAVIFAGILLYALVSKLDLGSSSSSEPVAVRTPSPTNTPLPAPSQSAAPTPSVTPVVVAVVTPEPTATPTPTPQPKNRLPNDEVGRDEDRPRNDYSRKPVDESEPPEREPVSESNERKITVLYCPASKLRATANCPEKAVKNYVQGKEPQGFCNIHRP